MPGRASAVVAAYTANELPEDARAALLREVVAAHDRGTRILIVEPIAKSSVALVARLGVTAFRAAGGREDEWRFPGGLPGITGRLGRAAGLDHRELTARTLYLGIR